MKALRSRLLAAVCLVFTISLFATLITGCQGLAGGTGPATATSLSLELNLSTLQFGNVAVGSTSTLSDTIYNPTGSSISITGGTVTNGAFSVSAPTFPASIGPGQSTTVSVAYTPTTAGANTGTLVLASSDPSDPSVTISLAASGVSPGQVAAQPQSLAFGSVNVGANQTISAILSNAGGTSVTISQVASSSAQFSLNGLTAPLTLATGQTASFSVTFSPTQTGSQTASLSISGSVATTASDRHARRSRTNATSAMSLTIPLSGTGMTPGQLTSTPGNLNFGNVTTGNTQTLSETLTNSGSASLTLNSATLSGTGFSMTGLTLPMTLAGGQSAAFSVTFSPQSAGAATGSIAVSSTDASGTMNIALSATGVAPGSLTLSPASLAFGSVQVGSTQKLSATVNNPGGSSITISQATASGTGFSMSGITLPLTLAAGQSATMSVTYTPQAAGNATGSVAIISNASNPSLTLPLTGTGVSAGTLAAGSASLSFGDVQTGSNQSLSETLANSGGSAVTISAATASGGGFSITGLTLPVTLNPGQSTSFNVVFAPQSAGNASGTVVLTSNASSPSLSIALTGNGIAPGSLASSPSALSFGSVTTATSQTLSETVTNSGGSSVTISASSVTGSGFSVSGLTLPLTLAAGKSTTFSVVFAPQAAGSVGGTVVLTSNAANPSLSIALSGSGVAPGSLAPNPSALSFGSVQTGSSQTISETVTNSGGTSVTITASSVTGSGFTLSGLTLPLTLAAGQNTSFTVKFAPQTAGNASGTVVLTSNASNSSLSIAVSGSGVAPGTLSPNPATLSFGSVQTGTTQPLSETVTNSGSSSVTISASSVTGSGFSVSGLALPLTLAAGQSTSFSVNFAPPAAGTASGTVVLTSNASNPSLSIVLSGTGIAPGSLSPNPASLSFGSVQVGNNSLQSETITNSGGTSVAVSQANITGSAFTLSGLTLPLTLTAGQSFTFGITFTPTASGSATGSLVLTSNAPVANLTISLSGTGTSPGQLAVSPATLSFGNVTVGANSPLTATLSATGSSVQVTAITPSTSEFTISGITLPATIAAGSNVQFTVTFTPQASGAASASLSFTSNASNTISEALTGTGQTPVQHSVALSWTASTSTVSGYNVYRTTTSGSNYVKLNSALDSNTTYTDSTVQSGQTYYYVTTSVDSSGTESSYSNQVQAVIPTP